jgi:hypothetical protein
MKKILVLSVILFCSIIHSYASLKPIATKIESQIKNGAIFTKYELFKSTESSKNYSHHLKDVVSECEVFVIDFPKLKSLFENAPENVDLVIPTSNGLNKNIKLFKTDIYAPGFNLFTSSSPNESFPYKGGVHYWGITEGDLNSIAAISIFENEVMGLITSPNEGNIVLGKLENAPLGYYILYNDSKLSINNPIECNTQDDENFAYSNNELDEPDRAIGDCIRLFWEVNYDIYTGKGSVANAANYVTGLFNQSAIIYANDGIIVELSEVFVWNTASPYVATTTSGLLGQFQNYRNSINGDLGHLLGYNGGGGIAAGFNGICASNLNSSQCYSGINSSYNNVPTYSWSVMVVTHEQGHLMGSRHTHACVWNGNNTAIDNCGPTAGYGYEGGCSGAPTPTGGGTIMSYCHLVGGVGINLANGFGLQPKNVIINKINLATCLTVCLGNTCLPSANMSTSNISNTSATFNWAAVTGAVGYHVRYRIIGDPNWQMTTVALTSYTASGLTPGANYEWQVETICTSGSSIFTISTEFITIPLTCDVPANQATTNIYYYGATFSWDAFGGALNYNLRYRQTGTTTWTTVNNISSPYSVYSLSQTTNYEWQVQTNCAGGGISSFGNSNLFTTPAEPCMIPEFLYTSNITSSAATLNFSQGSPIGGNGNPANLRYRVVGTTLWTTVFTTINYNAIGLLPGTNYEWQAEYVCGTTTSGFSQSVYFTTLCNPSSAVISGNGPTTFCAGNNVLLSAVPIVGYTFQWYNDNIAILNANSDSYTATTSGNYYLLEMIGGCIDTSNSIHVIVHALPSVNITVTGNTALCPGASVLLTSSEPSGNVWNTGATTSTITVSSAGIYSLIYTDANSCSASANIEITTSTNCVPTTQLRTADCGKQNLALNAALICNAVAGATNYDFEFTNLTTSVVGVKTTSTTSVSLSSIIPAIQFGTQYHVRVRAKVGGIYGNYGPICLIGTVCNPSVCGVPLTQLRASDCGKLNFSPLNGQIIADAVPAASQYEFEFRNITTNTLYATKLQASNVLAINSVLPNFQWNTQYNVKIRAYIAGIAGTYGPNCVIGFIPDPSVSGVPNTQLATASCGKTNLALTGSITCNVVTGASNYEWEFKDQGNTTVVATKITTGTTLILSSVSGLQWNTQYNVRVRATIGAVAGNYSVSCLIGLIPDPAINGVPSTKLRTSDCGKLNFGLGGVAVADVVSGAAEYEFEIRNNITNAFIANKLQASNVLTFSTVPAFQWNTQYKISVRARISSTWGSFGAACTIGFICDPNICGVASTALRSSDCGKLNFNFTTGYVVANAVAGATLYEFEITDLTTNTVVSLQSRTNTNLYFNSIVPTLQSNQQYSIRVRATISGVVGIYGNACTIGFASGSRESETVNEGQIFPEVNNTSFKIVMYPNPFYHLSKYYIESPVNEKMEVQIIDIFGKVVMTRTVNSNEFINIGEDLDKGIYFIKAIDNQGNQGLFKTLKLE